MALLSSLFRSSAPSAPTRRSAQLWRRQEFTAHSLGRDEQAVIVRGEVPLRVPGFAADFAHECKQFRSLEEHIAEHGEKHAWGSLEVEALRSWLPQLIEAGVLVSAEDVHQRCTSASSDEEPPLISAIGFPTGGDRVDLVQRALRSFAKNAREHSRTVDFLIVDSSPAAAQRAAFREGIAEKEVRVLYAGEEEKRALAADLRHAGIDPEVVEFALFDPLQTGFACGANRNALLLHQAGAMFCSIDDDVICELAAPPPSDTALKLFSQSDPFRRRIFADRESALAAAEFVERDFLAEHERLLGRGLASMCGGTAVDELDLSQLNDDLLKRLWRAPVQVRATFAGHLGDPGIPTSVYYLYYDGENRQHLTASEQHYRAALASRSVVSVAPVAAIGDASLSPGMAMGLDHRELLPPFFPVLHAEDFVFGATLWQSVSTCALGHLPVAVRHEPRAGKAILQPSQLGPQRQAVIFEFAHLIRRMILHFSKGEHANAATRMRMLGAHLAEIATQPASDFRDVLRRHVLEHESSKCDRLEEDLEESQDVPEFWRHDVEAYLSQVREALTAPDFDIPFDLKGARSAEENRVLMQQLVGRFGALLQAWPEMVQVARTSRERREWMTELSG